MNDFLMRLDNILENDRRFDKEAYFFVMAALGRVLDKLDKPRHVNGKELLDSIRKETEDQFGPMGATVFQHWGINNSLDFGEIVFNMVSEGILSKTEDDRVGDFEDSVFFENLFDEASGYHYSTTVNDGVINDG